MEKYEQLRTILNAEQFSELEQWCEASKEYYSGETQMSDPQFDNLEEILLAYDIPELTEFIETNIYRSEKGMEQVAEHTQEMISLKKEKYKDKSSIVECKKFFIGVRTPLWHAPKYDGGAGKITWDLQKRDIIQIISRGGLDITKFFKNHRDIRKTIEYGCRIITGEFVIKKQTFNDKYSDEYENARNFVGKLFKQNSIEQEIIDDLDFIPLTDGCNPLTSNIVGNSNAIAQTSIWAQHLPQEWYMLEQKIAFLKSDAFPYLCDGIVIAFDEPIVNGIPQRRIKDKYPLNMLAIKFPGETAKTKVLGFEWTQKKSGKLTPKLVIDPVPLGGATMTRANGYNYGNVLKAHIGIGSEIEIEKSGDIIPVVKKVHTYSKIVTLPECEYYQSGKHLIAKDLEQSRQYKFILGLKTLQLDGIGPVLADKIGSVVDYDIIKLFNAQHRPDIYAILGGGANFIKFKEFYEIRTLTLDKLIALLQFDNVGPAIALKLALIMTKQSTDKSNISGEILANVASGTGFQKIRDSMQYLKLNNVNIIAPVKVSDDALTFEMSGDWDVMTKSDFVKKLKEIFPNAMHTSLTKDTKYLFTHDLNYSSGKTNKARKNNVKIVLYSEALKGKL